MAEEPKNAFYIKMCVLTFALICIIFLAIGAIHILQVQKLFFRNEDQQNFTGFDSPMQKWRRFMGFTFMFILFIFIIIGILVGIVILILYFAKKDKDSLKDLIINLFWKCKTGDDTMKGFYISAGIAIIGMYLMFMLYTFFVKNYFSNIAYEVYHIDDDEDSEKKEFPQALKYITQYGFAIIVWLLVLLIFTIALKYKNIGDSDNLRMNLYKVMIKNLIYWILPFLVLSVAILRYYLIENVLWFFLAFMCFVGILIFNMKFYQ